MSGRIAVTGALGFVASRLFPRLPRAPLPIAIVRPGRDAGALAAFDVEVRRCELGSPTPEAFAGAEAVVHLAGMSLATALVPAWEAAGVERVVCVSSAGVHTRLPSAGAEAKRHGEAALAASRLRWTVLRPSMIYGTPRDRNLVRLLRWIQRCPCVPLPGGGMTPQQPVHVDDLAHAILAALARREAAGRAYDVGGPEPITLRELVAECASALGRPAFVLSVPLAPAWHATRLARRLGLPWPVRPEQVLRLAESKAVDIGPARADLGFAPRGFRDGIRAEASELRSAGHGP